MKKILLLASVFLGLQQSAIAQDCFIAQTSGKILVEEGDCRTRFAPESTFKVPLSLIGYDAGILKDEIQPEWPYQEGYDNMLVYWKKPHNPKSWMRDSCIWYSKVLTQQLGMPAFSMYVKKLAYGNQDLSGDPGKNNGLTNAWLSSSLQISPHEQTQFMQKIAQQALPLSKHAHEKTKNIMYIQDMPAGWKLYGKTGTGTLPKQNDREPRHGWFVGWIEKDGQIISFATHIVDANTQAVPASFRARNEAMNKLWPLINEAEIRAMAG